MGGGGGARLGLKVSSFLTSANIEIVVFYSFFLRGWGGGSCAKSSRPPSSAEGALEF